MKGDEIAEIMRGPNYDKVANKYGEQNKERWYNNGKHIGDIEEYNVRQDGKYYTVWDNQSLIAYSSLENENNIVDDVWVHPDYRQQRIFSKMLWFYKTRLNRSTLMLGKVHSPTIQEVVKGLSRFDKYWLNIKTNETEPFELDTLDNFYDYLAPTPWRLMLENNGDFSDWPLFSEGMSYIKEDYTEITK